MVAPCITDFCAGCSIADGIQGVAGGIDAFGRTIDIDIGLRPQPRVHNIIGRLRESLDNDVLHSSLLERFSRFPVGSLDALEAESIVGKICFEPLDDPVRKSHHGELCNL
jgi:hypothetical protein